MLYFIILYYIILHYITLYYIALYYIYIIYIHCLFIMYLNILFVHVMIYFHDSGMHVFFLIYLVLYSFYAGDLPNDSLYRVAGPGRNCRCWESL